MAHFHYREGTDDRGRLLTAQAAAVLVIFLIIVATLLVQGHPTAGLSLLGITGFFAYFFLFLAWLLKKATGRWEIEIDNEFFRWSSPHPSLGPTIDIPIKDIRSMIITNYPWSEAGSDKRYQLVLEDGSRTQLWGWDSAPMDRIAECVGSNGVPLLHENA
jgi:Zn-dependent protease with chaperone function